MKYERIVFLCHDNTNLSPMAESLFLSMYQGEPVYVASRGLVVLYEAPCNPKTEVVLSNHGMTLVRPTTSEIQEADMTSRTLVIAMSEELKAQFHKRFPHIAVCTLKRIAGEEGALKDPYGGTLIDYEECFVEMSRLIKKTIIQIEEANRLQPSAIDTIGLFETE